MPQVIKDTFDPDVSPSAEFFRYLSLYILILQGGGGFDHGLALAGTAMFFAMFTGLDYMYPGGLVQLPVPIAQKKAIDKAKAAVTQPPAQTTPESYYR